MFGLTETDTALAGLTILENIRGSRERIKGLNWLRDVLTLKIQSPSALHDDGWFQIDDLRRQVSFGRLKRRSHLVYSHDGQRTALIHGHYQWVTFEHKLPAVKMLLRYLYHATFSDLKGGVTGGLSAVKKTHSHPK